jgi:tRNA modification GTPase
MLLSHDEQIIIAQCTPRASGAIALLRISGIGCVELVDTFARLASGKKLQQLPSHTIHYGAVVDAQGICVDQVLFLLMCSPKTFTGQDTVEITCHNNQFIIETIISIAITHGARLAQEGEFTKRAVLSGKIDLVQAEAINELIHAQTQMALKKSLEQLSGSFSNWIGGLEKDLLKALALSEASFEFLDEEMEFGSQIQQLITTIQQAIARLKKSFNQQQQIRQGIRIALIGAVNAGKSSLFNALLNQQRAIVNAQAGTTRDSIEAGLYKNGNYWTLIDTAGLRNADDEIEQEGIARSFDEAHKADIVILAQDGSRVQTEHEIDVYQKLQHHYAHKIILVHTKSDIGIRHKSHSNPSTQPSHEASAGKQAGPLVLSRVEGSGRAGGNIDLSARGELVESIRAEHSNPILAVSSKTKNNIAMLEQALEYKIATLFKTIESPFLLNQRQFNLLLALETKLENLQTMLRQKPIAYELLSVHLQDCISHLSELSGKTISEAGMDMVFREFCVGK